MARGASSLKDKFSVGYNGNVDRLDELLSCLGRKSTVHS